MLSANTEDQLRNPANDVADGSHNPGRIFAPWIRPVRPNEGLTCRRTAGTERSAQFGISRAQRRARNVVQDTLADVTGGPRGEKGRRGGAGLETWSATGSNAMISWTDAMEEDSIGNCPCAKKWQIGQSSIEAWRAPDVSTA